MCVWETAASPEGARRRVGYDFVIIWEMLEFEFSCVECSHFSDLYMHTVLFWFIGLQLASNFSWNSKFSFHNCLHIKCDRLIVYYEFNLEIIGKKNSNLNHMSSDGAKINWNGELNLYRVWGSVPEKKKLEILVKNTMRR